MGVSRVRMSKRISYTLIPKFVNIFSLFSSPETQMWQLPASRFSASELNLIDQAPQMVLFLLKLARSLLTKKLHFEPRSLCAILYCKSNHSLSFYPLLFQELLPYPSTKLSLTPEICVMDI